MSGYLASGETYVICTNAIAGSSRQLTVVSCRRDNLTNVKWGSKGKVLLVDVDTHISQDFPCQTKWNSIVSKTLERGFMGIGILAGAAMVGMMIPGPGWLVAGVCVGIVAGAALLGAWEGGLFDTAKCQCNKLLNPCFWEHAHQTVKFNKKLAITHYAVLHCKEGGVLLPFPSKDAADAAAAVIRNWNIVNMSLNGIVSAAGVFFTGSGLILKPIPTLIGLAVGTIIDKKFGADLFALATSAESYGLRALNESDDNQIYKNMNRDGTSEDLNPNITLKKDNNTPDSGFSSWLPSTILSSQKQFKVDFKGQSSTLNNAIANSQQGGSNAGNQDITNIMKDYRYRSIYTNSSGNHRGMNNPSRHTTAMGRANHLATWDKYSSIAEKMTFVSPFISTFIQEEVRVIAADKALKGVADSLTIYSQKY